jgi:hypothetical protein
MDPSTCASSSHWQRCCASHWQQQQPQQQAILTTSGGGCGCGCTTISWSGAPSGGAPSGGAPSGGAPLILGGGGCVLLLLSFPSSRPNHDGRRMAALQQILLLQCAVCPIESEVRVLCCVRAAVKDNACRPKSQQESKRMQRAAGTKAAQACRHIKIELSPCWADESGSRTTRGERDGTFFDGGLSLSLSLSLRARMIHIVYPVKE